MTVRNENSKNLVLIFYIMQDVIQWSETYFNGWNTELESNLWFTLFNQLNITLCTVNFQKVVLMLTTICLKHFLQRCRVLVNLIFDTKWFNLLFGAWTISTEGETRPVNRAGFPTSVKNMLGEGGRGASKFDGGGGLSKYMGKHKESFQEKGKYLGNICTVACKLKNYIFLLN